MARPLEAEEVALVALVERAGFSAPTARVLAALARGGGQTAGDLAAITGLSRQEAGDAARALELRGLARVEKVASGGRPSHRYHLLREGVAPFIEQRREALLAEIAMLDELAERFA